VGAFVIGAIVIAVAAVVTVGSGRFFRNTRTFVVFFQGSVNGLDKGAPVKFRGVRIGTVTDIRLALPGQGDVNRIPVLIEIDRDRLEEFGASADAVVGKRLYDLIYKRGLRAQLQQQSFITGLLYVGLDYFPDSKLDLILPPGGGSYPEIPSQPTTLEEARAKIEELFDRVSHIDFDAFGKSVTGAVDGVNRLVNSPEVYSNLEALHETLVEIRGATTDLRARILPLSTNANATVNDLRGAIKRLQASVDRFDSLIDPNAPLLGTLAATLADVGEAARAVRQLAEQLDRNPSVLLTGKKAP
jgi:phospholipid/cholesterol/gamma-HCH transport system substrate-binding protein